MLTTQQARFDRLVGGFGHGPGRHALPTAPHQEQEAAVGRALPAMLRTVAGREEMGALAVDRLVDRRFGYPQRGERHQCDNPCHLCS